MHETPTTCCPLMFPASPHSVKALNSWAPVPPLICSSQPTSTQCPKAPPSVTLAVLTASNSGVPHAVFRARSVRRMLFVVPYACVGPPAKTCSSVDLASSLIAVSSREYHLLCAVPPGVVGPHPVASVFLSTLASLVGTEWQASSCLSGDGGNRPHDCGNRPFPLRL